MVFAKAGIIREYKIAIKNALLRARREARSYNHLGTYPKLTRCSPRRRDQFLPAGCIYLFIYQFAYRPIKAFGGFYR